jgi:DUF1680 family protein
MERLMYNGILSSPGLDGTGYFYVNPLMLRNGRYVRLSTNPDEQHKNSGRPEWHSVSCCPPNVMRLFASLPNYFVTRTETGIQIHQYSNMKVSAGQNRLAIETQYPWDGRVKVNVTHGADEPWKLSLRIPGWCQSFGIRVNGQDVSGSLETGYLTIERTWATGDVVELRCHHFGWKPIHAWMPSVVV